MSLPYPLISADELSDIIQRHGLALSDVAALTSTPEDDIMMLVLGQPVDPDAHARVSNIMSAYDRRAGNQDEEV